LLTVNGSSSFDTVTVKTDDPIFIGAGVPLMASAASVNPDGIDTAVLSDKQLIPIIEEAVSRWIVSAGLDGIAANLLRSATFTIVDLPGLTIGKTLGNTIMIDTTAAGFGWFIDSAPSDDAEFTRYSDGRLVAPAASAAYGDMDLLTVVMHELGHILGLADVNVDSANVMSDTLATGIRRTEIILNQVSFSAAAYDAKTFQSIRSRLIAD